MEKILICWIGLTDLKASENINDAVGAGPICQAVRELVFDEIHLISDRSDAENESYIHWLKSKATPEITLHITYSHGPTLCVYILMGDWCSKADTKTLEITGAAGNRFS